MLAKKLSLGRIELYLKFWIQSLNELVTNDCWKEKLNAAT